MKRVAMALAGSAWLVCWATVLPCGRAMAQTNATTARLLGEVVRSNPELRIYEQALAAARADVATAGKPTLPQLQTEAG